MSHETDRQFACNVCGKTFRFLPNLYDHRTIHDENAELHKCPMCEKQCRLKGNLKKHFRTHFSTEAEAESSWKQHMG